MRIDDGADQLSQNAARQRLREALPGPEELPGSAYIVIIVAVAVIVGGLSWAFYRAAKAEGIGDDTLDAPPPDPDES